MSDETEIDRLRAENTLLRKATATLAECCYLPCDQTAQCGECGAVWWDVPEDMDENWHADGCELFAAEVALGKSVDVRKGPAPERCNPWMHPVNETSAKAIRAELTDACERADKAEATVREFVVVARAYLDAHHDKFDADTDPRCTPAEHRAYGERYEQTSDALDDLIARHA